MSHSTGGGVSVRFSPFNMEKLDATLRGLDQAGRNAKDGGE